MPTGSTRQENYSPLWVTGFNLNAYLFCSAFKVKPTTIQNHTVKKKEKKKYWLLFSLSELSAYLQIDYAQDDMFKSLRSVQFFGNN